MVSYAPFLTYASVIAIYGCSSRGDNSSTATRQGLRWPQPPAPCDALTWADSFGCCLSVPPVRHHRLCYDRSSAAKEPRGRKKKKKKRTNKQKAIKQDLKVLNVKAAASPAPQEAIPYAQEN